MLERRTSTPLRPLTAPELTAPELTAPELTTPDLTAAERRVVSLVAMGRTNAEIAELLVVSRRTVESQVGAAYREFGVSSRVKLALVAEEAGLVA